MSLWICAMHGLYGGQVHCPRCGVVGSYATFEENAVPALWPVRSMSREEVEELYPSRYPEELMPIGRNEGGGIEDKLRELREYDEVFEDMHRARAAAYDRIDAASRRLRVIFMIILAVIVLAAVTSPIWAS